MGQFLIACLLIRAASDIVPRYCTDFTDPVPDTLLDRTPQVQGLDLRRLAARRPSAARPPGLDGGRR